MLSATSALRKMAKKSRWENDQAGFDNPFAILKNPGSTAATPDVVPLQEPKKEIRLPKVKSARKERADRGGKTVTRVFFHGEPSSEEQRAWLKHAKTTLGLGGSMDEKGVFLQGDQLERMKDAGLLP